MYIFCVFICSVDFVIKVIVVFYFRRASVLQIALILLLFTVLCRWFHELQYVWSTYIVVFVESIFARPQLVGDHGQSQDS